MTFLSERGASQTLPPASVPGGFFPDLSHVPYLSIDTETTGLDPNKGAKVFMFGVSLPDGTDIVHDLRYTPQAKDWLNDQMKTYRNPVVCHNASFDYRLCKATGIDLPLRQLRDTCVQHTLVNEHEMSYALDNLSKKYCKTHKTSKDLYTALKGEFGGLASKNVQMPRISQVTNDMLAYDTVVEYQRADARSTLELHEYQSIQIAKQGLERIVDFETRLVPYVIRQEMHGVRVDTDAAQLAVVQISSTINRLQAELDNLVGFRCNVNAPADVKRIFDPCWRNDRWETRAGEPLGATDKGNVSVAAGILTPLKDPAAKLVLALRSYLKTRDTFLMGHVLGNEIGGRIYPSINQAKTDTGLGTGTGRFSYAGPALQQIPSRDEIAARMIKSIFLPDEGQVWVDSDMSAFEVRTFFHHANVPSMTQRFEDDPETDAHQIVADLMGIPRKPPKGGGPSGKQMNLAMLYNQGKGSTADSLGLPWEWDSFTPKGEEDEIVFRKAGEEAQELIQKYHSYFPGVAELIKGCAETAKRRGHLFTPHGRHLHLYSKKLAYKMVAILSQATAADFNKENVMMAMDTLDEMSPESHFLLNVHDSYGCSMPEEDVYKTFKEIKGQIESDRGLRIPLVLEVSKPGVNWWASIEQGRLM